MLVHYISMALLLLFYPLFLVSQIIHLGFVIPMLEHALLVTIFALAYELNKAKLPDFAQISGIWFLSMAFVFPVMYITMTPPSACNTWNLLLGNARHKTKAWSRKSAGVEL